MSDHTATLSRPAARTVSRGDSAARLPAGLGRPLLAHAALLGIAGDTLLREGPTGVGFSIWIALVAVALLSLAWRAERTVPAETTLWLLIATCFASVMSWRESTDLQQLDALAVLASLGFAATTLSAGGSRVLLARVRDALLSGMHVLGAVIRGIVPLTLRELFQAAEHDDWSGRARPAFRATLIVGVLVLVFGSLLGSADPIFASFVTLPDFNVGEILSHVVLIGFFAWLPGGLAIGALAEPTGAHRTSAGIRARLGLLDVTTALATLNVLFGVFMLAQLGWLFGGEAFLRARTGLSAAQYARQGFFEMVWIVVLVMPLLLVTRALLEPGRAVLRRYTALAIPVVVLLGAMIGSAALRMQLYVHYYGLTLDRLDTLVFMGWLGFVLCWLAATVLRGRPRLFVAGSTLAGFATLAALNVFTPDVIVARENVARAQSSGVQPLDVSYLAELGAETTDITLGALLAPAARATTTASSRCEAARRLLSRWGTDSSRAQALRSRDGWRTWNLGERDAMRAVQRNEKALEVIANECPLKDPKS
ncbi:MAG: DUF4173 domain-containing protein [Gemmatimonadaceae bacterium]